MMNKLLLLLIVVALSCFAFNSANALPGDPTDIAWHKCAEQALVRYNPATPGSEALFKKDFCKFLGTKEGEECDTDIALLKMSGAIVDAASEFAMRLIMPKCGDHPE